MLVFYSGGVIRELRYRALIRIRTSWACSGGRFEHRVTLGQPRTAALRASGRPPAGFRGLRRGTHYRQERRETSQDARWGQPPRPLQTLPGQSHVGDDGTRQPQLGVGGQYQPGPTVGLLWVAHPRRGPAQGLFHEAYRVFEVEPATVRPPDEVEIRLALPAPPKPQLLRLASLPGQLAHLDQDHGALHHGCPLAPVALAYASGLRVQTAPRPDAH